MQCELPSFTRTKVPSDKLNNLENQINATFDGIIDKVNRRRIEVLDRLREAVDKSKKASDSIKKLDQSKHKFQEDFSETLGDVREEMLSIVDKKIATINLENPEYMFVCDQLELDRALSILGGIVRVPTEYNSKLKPMSSCNIEFKSPIAISFDESLNLIALIGHNKNEVVLFDIDGNIVNRIQDISFKELRAIEMVDHRDIYMTDIETNEIFKYNTLEGNFVGKFNRVCKSQEKLKRPSGICFDKFTNSIFVTLSNSHSIAVFNTDLLKTDEFKPELMFPQFIQTTENEIFILDCNNPCLHVISKKERTALRSMIPRGFELYFRKGITRFSLDPKDNILIINFTNKLSSSIQVYSPCGQLIHVLSSKEIGSIPCLFHVKSNFEIVTIALFQRKGWVIQIL